MTQKRNFRKIAQQLGKRTMFAIIAILIVGAVNAQKPKLAVMDFVAGVGLYQKDVNGLSDMLINSLFNTGRFELIERGQLCELIGETNLQKSSLSAGQLQQLKIKGVNFLLLGTANLTEGEYNIDVRVVDVGTGKFHSTAEVTKLSGQTYRTMMPKLANELATKLPQTVNATITTEKPKGHIVILYDYLTVYPEDLGNFSAKPTNLIDNLNKNNSYGFNNWRLPTTEELEILKNNSSKIGLQNSSYMSVDNSNGIVRLVRTEGTVVRKSQANTSSAYVNSMAIFEAMPETAAAEIELANLNQSIRTTLQRMEDEYNKKYTEFMQQQDYLDQGVKIRRIQEIEDIKNRIESFYQQAEKDIAKKREDLTAPIVKKIQAAIQDVGDENGFASISEEGALLHKGGLIDATPLVKEKLGVR